MDWTVKDHLAFDPMETMMYDTLLKNRECPKPRICMKKSASRICVKYCVKMSETANLRKKLL
jgi:hypothetical protein